MRPFVSGAGREQYSGGAGSPARPAGQVHVPAEQREADAPPLPSHPPPPQRSISHSEVQQHSVLFIRTRSDNYVASRLKKLCHEMNIFLKV
jgi:hypothetical protein